MLPIYHPITMDGDPIPFWLSIVIISFIENERKLETIVIF
jgi:hypothetical protein